MSAPIAKSAVADLCRTFLACEGKTCGHGRARTFLVPLVQQARHTYTASWAPDTRHDDTTTQEDR